MRVNTVVCVVLLVAAAACAGRPTCGLYDDPAAAAEAERAWAVKLTEADLGSLARRAREKIEACLASETMPSRIRVMAVEDRSGENADTVTLTERMEGEFLRGGKVRPTGELKARLALASVLSMDAASSEYRLALALSESGAAGNRCQETVVLSKAAPGAAE